MRGRDMPRDAAFEDGFTEGAAALVKLSARALNAYADGRTMPGPVRQGFTRDMVRETREELADARNYLCWRALQSIHEGRGDDLPFIADALADVVTAWHSLDRLALVLER